MDSFPGRGKQWIGEGKMRKVKGKRDVGLWIDFECVFEPAKQNSKIDRIGYRNTGYKTSGSLRLHSYFCKVTAVTGNGCHKMLHVK